MGRFIEGLEPMQQQPKHLLAMKTWLNEFLQNAAFPAVVLAFACSLINNETPDVRKDSSTANRRRLARTQISYSDRSASEEGNSKRKGLP
jgi:hypothetical protein